MKGGLPAETYVRFAGWPAAATLCEKRQDALTCYSMLWRLGVFRKALLRPTDWRVERRLFSGGGEEKKGKERRREEGRREQEREGEKEKRGKEHRSEEEKANDEDDEGWVVTPRRIPLCVCVMCVSFSVLIVWGATLMDPLRYVRQQGERPSSRRWG